MPSTIYIAAHAAVGAEFKTELALIGLGVLVINADPVFVICAEPFIGFASGVTGNAPCGDHVVAPEEGSTDLRTVFDHKLPDLWDRQVVLMPKMTVRDHGIIRLGKQGENKVLQVIWRGIVPEWEEKYGTGEFQLAVRRNQDTAPYIANIELDGGDIVWTITSAETARVGDGECELTYTVGDSIAKSQIWTITVCESLTGQEPVDPPEPAKNWVDVVIKSASDAKQSATESAESAVNAQKSAENAADSANEAHKSREAIENMEASAVSLPPNSKATVEKDLVDGKVKLTFGIPRGESDIFWLNTVSYGSMFDKITLHIHQTGDHIPAGSKIRVLVLGKKPT